MCFFVFLLQLIKQFKFLSINYYYFNDIFPFKGDLYENITFIRCLNTVVWPEPAWKSPAHLWRCPLSIDTAIPEWESVVRLCHYWLFAVAIEIQCQRQRSFSSVVFWDALTNIWVSLDSTSLYNQSVNKPQTHAGKPPHLMRVTIKY